MNNTTKHTPGPLHNITGHKPGPWIRQVLNDESEAYIHDKHCNAIARVYSLSDASLIAAAPAMYEALVEMVELRKQLAIDHPHLFVGKAVLLRAETALAQPEGTNR